MLRKLFIVMRGTVLAQLLGIAALPLISRLYPVEAFGHLQLFQSVLTILLVFATMRFEIALLKADSEEEVRTLLVICAGTNLFLSLLLAVATGILLLFVPGPAGIGIPFALWLLPLGFLVGGTLQYVTYWLTREESFALNANAKVVQSGASGAYAVTAGFVGAPVNGLIHGDILGRIVALLCFIPWARGQLVRPGAAVTRARLRAALHRYREFPLVSVPGGLINALGGVATPILIYSTFSASVAGQFGLMERALTLPLALVIASVSQVYSSEFARAGREGSQAQRQVFHRYARLLLLAGVLPMVLLLAGGPSLFMLLFGPQWAEAGAFARTMAPTYLLLLVAGGTNMSLMLLGMQKTQMLWEIGRLGSIALLWVVARKADFLPSTVVLGHAVVIGCFSLMFLVLTELLLRRRGIADRESGPEKP